MVTDAIAFALVGAKLVLIGIGLVFLVSGLDDLFIDLVYYTRAVYRRFFVRPKYPPLREEVLRAHPEQPIAVLIPAWDESAVIQAMLRNTLRSLDYRQVVLFVGTYPNDAATQAEVEKVRETSAQVEKVVTGSDGPTNKADCLNWIYQGIRAYEKRHDVRFEIFVMQDCEDVIHPLCYRLFNYLIPRKDMVQLPVLSLPRKWWEFTGGHYLDEFSQLHYKDLVVREVLDRSIPAAGVGCAFSRRAFETVAGANDNQLFSIDSLTEDYDFGFRLKQFGLKQVFVKFPIFRTVLKTPWWGRHPRPATVSDLVSIREYFPSNFTSAVKQKSRWVLGITLQGWANLGWLGGLRTRYMLYRDRKSLITNLANMLGYVVVACVLMVWALEAWLPGSYRFPSIVDEGSLLWYLIIANGVLLSLRLFQRAYCVGRLYGPLQALLALPRSVWGNVINFFATVRAIRLYARYLRTGKLIAWDKTAHTYPGDEVLATRLKLGELLLEQRLVTLDVLQQALQRQRASGQRLGEILRDMGVIGEGDLAGVLRMQ